MSELVAVEQANIPEVFQHGGTDALVQRIKDQVEGIVGTTSTLKGRKEIASLAAKVAKSKTYLDGLGKTYVAELKAIPKAVDAERKRMRDTLDALKETVRRPLTEWEAVEEKRIQRHESNIQEIIGSSERALAEWETMSLDVMNDRLSEIEEEKIDESWEEYKSDAAKAKELAIRFLKEAIEKRQKHDDEQAELAELRRAKAEQEQKDRDEAMRREGEEKARREVESREQAAIQAKADAEQREQEAVIAGELAKQNAERRAKEAEEQAQKKAEAAAQAERDRIESELAAEKEAAKKRETNLQHRGRINRAAMAKLVELGLSEAKAKEVVTAIAKGLVPACQINY